MVERHHPVSRGPVTIRWGNTWPCFFVTWLAVSTIWRKQRPMQGSVHTHQGCLVGLMCCPAAAQVTGLSLSLWSFFPAKWFAEVVVGSWGRLNRPQLPPWESWKWVHWCNWWWRFHGCPQQPSPFLLLWPSLSLPCTLNRTICLKLRNSGHFREAGGRAHQHIRPLSAAAIAFHWPSPLTPALSPLPCHMFPWLPFQVSSQQGVALLGVPSVPGRRIPWTKTSTLEVWKP